MQKGNKKFKNSKKQNDKFKGRFVTSEELKQRVISEAIPSGEYLFNYRIPGLKKQFEHLPEKELKKKLKIMFGDTPLSRETLNGLKRKKFFKMTEIQRCVIPHALSGRDILAASKTGSGKTLAFLGNIKFPTSPQHLIIFPLF
jgi:ATP-dependent RNA helicase DDX10/DBP4